MVIKAGSVTNLTDARFFAAFAVDHVGFCFDPLSENYISPQNALAIKGWIQGPKIVAEFANQDNENIKNIIDFFQPDIIELGEDFFNKDDAFSFIGDWNKPVIRKMLINKLPEVKEDYLFILIEDSPGINLPVSSLPLMFDVSAIDHDLVNPSFGAIQIKGGKESETGIKDYDELATLLENLGR